MTNKEAIKWLDTFKDHTGMTELSQAFDVAIQTLRKQIPQQVELEGDGYDPDGNLVYDYAQCPNCQRAFEESDENWECNYCPNCGQALNWWGNECTN